MAKLQVILEIDHALACRADSWQAGGSAAAWVVSTWVTRETSEVWLAVSCNDPLCSAAGLILQESILDHARMGLAKATPERPSIPNALEERDRQREEKRLAAGGTPREVEQDVLEEADTGAVSEEPGADQEELAEVVTV